MAISALLIIIDNKNKIKNIKNRYERENSLSSILPLTKYSLFSSIYQLYYNYLFK